MAMGELQLQSVTILKVTCKRASRSNKREAPYIKTNECNNEVQGLCGQIAYPGNEIDDIPFIKKVEAVPAKGPRNSVQHGMVYGAARQRGIADPLFLSLVTRGCPQRNALSKECDVCFVRSWNG